MCVNNVHAFLIFVILSFVAHINYENIIFQIFRITCV